MVNSNTVGPSLFGAQGSKTLGILNSLGEYTGL